MIRLKDQEVFIKCPCEIDDLPPSIKNSLRTDMDIGYSIFVIPEDLENSESDQAKNHKKSYKVGFLFDCLTVLYPSYGKEKKAEIISEKYHLWFTYRQFKNLLDEYESKREDYLKRRSSL